MDTSKLEQYVSEQIKDSPRLAALDSKDMLCFAVTGLNEEAGEVAGLLCREVYKKKDISSESWQDELGDVLWYLVAATIAKGLTLEDLYIMNADKLAERYGVGRSKEENNG